MRIEPTQGRVVWFFAPPGLVVDGRFLPTNPLAERQRYAAMIAFVLPDGRVNVGMMDHTGAHASYGPVRLIQEGSTPASPGEAYCEWMPYQKGQAAKTEQVEGDRRERQRRVGEFVRTRFGEANMDRRERAARLLEEALELAQAEGMSSPEVVHLASYVYSRPPGDPLQEAGGIGVALLGYCEGVGIYADDAEKVEIARIYSLPIEHFKQRHAAKAAAGVAAPAE